jgi:hypothetical protein
MKTESEVGITIRLSKVQKRVAETTRVSRRTLCRVLQEGENVETGVAMAFSTPRKLRPKVCAECILDNFDESVLSESTGYRGGVSSLRLVLGKVGFI